MHFSDKVQIDDLRKRQHIVLLTKLQKPISNATKNLLYTIS